MSKQTTGSLAATGSVTLTKPDTDTLTVVQISGTYGTVTFVFEGTIDGTLWFPIVAVLEATGAIVTGTISPSDNATSAWKVPSEGLAGVRARVSAIASGTANFALNSASYIGLPFTSQNNAGSTIAGLQTFSAGISFNGATGVNLISMPDNLASSLDITEGANSYLKFITTDAGEKIQLGKDLDLPAARKFTILDNSTAALDITEAGNSYLKFITSNAAEAVVIGKSLTMSQGASTAAAGTTTADAGALPAGTGFMYPTSAADGTKGVKINAADKVDSRAIFIGNGVSTATLKIYAPAGGAINGAAADAAYVTASGKGALVVCLSSAGNTWLALG